MISKFAKNSDIKMLVEEKQINTTQFRRFLARKGIFSLASNAKELSNQTYQLFFGSKDIEYLKDVIQTSSNYEKSSLIILKPTEEYESMDEFIDDLNEDIQAYRMKESKYVVEEIHKDSEGCLHITISYVKNKRGKNELIKSQKKNIAMKVEKLDDENKLILDIRQNDNSDLKELDKFIEEINIMDEDSKLFIPEYLAINRLSNKNKIKLYDELIKFSHEIWRLEDITGVDVKKNESLEDDDLEISTDELTGINTAIFKGDGIRNTGIVKKFEKQGFYFTSMKFKYAFKHNLESFIIDINFKGNENIKIDIVKIYDKDNDKDITIVLPKNEQEEIIRKFQQVTYNIYNKLIQEQVEDRQKSNYEGSMGI